MNRRDFFSKLIKAGVTIAIAPTLIDAHDGSAFPPLIADEIGLIGNPGPIGDPGIPGYIIKLTDYLARAGHLIIDKKGDVYRVQCKAKLYHKDAQDDEWLLTAIKSTITTGPDETAMVVFGSAMQEGDHRITATDISYGRATE